MKVVQVHVRVGGPSTEWQQYRVSRGSIQNGWSSFNSRTRKWKWKWSKVLFSNTHRHIYLEWPGFCVAFIYWKIFIVVNIFANFLFLFLSFVSARGWLSVPGAALVSTLKSKDRYCKNWSIEQSTRPTCLVALFVSIIFFSNLVLSTSGFFAIKAYFCVFCVE